MNKYPKILDNVRIGKFVISLEQIANKEFATVTRNVDSGACAKTEKHPDKDTAGVPGSKLTKDKAWSRFHKLVELALHRLDDDTIHANALASMRQGRALDKEEGLED